MTRQIVQLRVAGPKNILPRSSLFHTKNIEPDNRCLSNQRGHYPASTRKHVHLQSPNSKSKRESRSNWISRVVEMNRSASPSAFTFVFVAKTVNEDQSCPWYEEIEGKLGIDLDAVLDSRLYVWVGKKWSWLCVSGCKLRLILLQSYTRNERPNNGKIVIFIFNSFLVLRMIFVRQFWKPFRISVNIVLVPTRRMQGPVLRFCLIKEKRVSVAVTFAHN